MNLTNSEIVQYLANGYTIVEIEKETGINRRTLEKRLVAIRNISSCKTYGHVIATYLRKKIID